MSDVVTALIVVFAAYRITRLIIRDDFPPVANVRNRILARHPTISNRYYGSEVDDPRAKHTHVDLDGRTIPVTISDGDSPYVLDLDGNLYAEGDHPTWQPDEDTTIGTLITCVWCAGFWVSTLTVLTVWAGTRYPLPAVGWWAAPFALSAVVVAADRIIDP